MSMGHKDGSYRLVVLIRSVVLFAGSCFFSPVCRQFNLSTLLYSFITSSHMYLYMNFAKILKGLDWPVSIDFFFYWFLI